MANRAALRDALASALSSAQVGDRQVALLWVDIDDFREVNDAHGYAAGDLVLRTVADRLRAAVRPGDVLARAGGDEFLLLVRDVDDVWTLAEEIGGGSSSMPHKHNPVLSVLVRRAALTTPQLGATLHLAAADQVDERADGAWHAEWDTLRLLVRRTVVAVEQTADLVSGLQVRR